MATKASAKRRVNSPVVAPYSDVREVPGSDSNKLWQLLRLVRYGQGYFQKLMVRHRSTVFRVNMGVKAIAVCDRKGLDAIFDVDIVRKIPAFGRLNYNLSMLDGHIPSIFSNDASHEKQKAFAMKLCKLAQEAQLLPTAQRVVTRYLVRWRDADMKLRQAWEADIRALTCDIIIETFLGIHVNPSCMFNMLKGSWAKPKTKKFTRAMHAASHLKESFRKSPKLREILRLAAEAGLSEEQAIADILFMFNFNAYAGISGAIIGCLARLTVVDADYKEAMRREIVSALDREGVTYEALAQMKKLHNYVLEAIRLSPPVPVIFGTARNDFTLHASKGKFRIKEGELLVGNVYEVQRDPNVFYAADVFEPSRFEDEYERKRMYDHIVFANGPLTEKPTARNHHCPGQEIIYTVLKVVIMNVLVCCDFKLTRTPVWTGKNLRRIGSPDNLVKLSSFRYFPQHPLLPKDVKDMEVSDIEDHEPAVTMNGSCCDGTV